ncbi:MAG: class I SAM-dependent methyltransferase [Rhodospirillaceae bacterium]|nr:class I SAM-dependent methyltransferase [Rhodospirillaceae bacterium]
MATPAAVDARTHRNLLSYERKPVVRALYADLYRRILAALRPGPTVEVGGGGTFKAFAREAAGRLVVTVDVSPAPGLDAVADAHRLPFAGASLANLVAFDVLHHIEFPAVFFREAARVLAPGGRIVLVEPAITPLSGLFYRLFHDEPVAMRADPWRDGEPTPGRDPFAANQAIPTIMLVRQRERFSRAFPELTIRELRFLSLIAYPLSGGFKDWCLVPRGLVRPLLALEERLLPAVGALAAFRLFAVVERSGVPPTAAHAFVRR